ncbi:FecR family protein [Acaryochloris sp. IP29b_bin.148]|uniref:FecR family protein n=1 Tax=Acaryochloris sp. IP29b_bin.148 TaxID=2969218 RepID=UPI00260DF1B6|nr:FecR family protein [Acaryochloris sp. IP29b_bin.148]
MGLKGTRWLTGAFAGSILFGAFSQPVLAGTNLTSAKVYDFDSQVQLEKVKKKPRLAKIGDVMVPMDILKTGSSAWAKLLFNEGTLFRVHANAKFFFVPNTRSFQLKHGLVLSMIQPGQGITTVITPTAKIVAFGTALTVRHDSTQNTTIVSALTEKLGRPIFVSNDDGAGQIRLKAGEQVEIKDNVVGPVKSFSLPAFYQACPMSAVLDPKQEQLVAQEPTEVQSPLFVIREETAKAVAEQSTIADASELTKLCAPVPELPEEEKTRPNSGPRIGVGGCIPIPFISSCGPQRPGGLPNPGQGRQPAGVQGIP